MIKVIAVSSASGADVKKIISDDDREYNAVDGIRFLENHVGEDIIYVYDGVNRVVTLDDIVIEKNTGIKKLVFNSMLSSGIEG